MTLPPTALDDFACIGRTVAHADTGERLDVYLDQCREGVRWYTLGRVAKSEVIDNLRDIGVAAGIPEADVQVALGQALENPLDLSGRKVSPAAAGKTGTDSNRGALQVLSPTEWQGIPVPVREWTVPNLIPSRNVTMLSGDGGDGKTLLVLQLMVAAAINDKWISERVGELNSFGLFCEDEADELHRRLSGIADHLGCEPRDLAGISIASRVGEDNILVEFDDKNCGKTTPLYDAITAHALDFGARLVVLDSLHDVFGGNEIIRTQARTFISHLRKLALAIDGAVLVNAHPSAAGLSSGSGTSGSTAWNNAVRSRLYLTRDRKDGADDNVRILQTKKMNYGPRGHGMKLRWQNGVFVPDTETASPETVAAALKAEDVFLDLLTAYEAEMRSVSPSPSSSFGPSIFAKDNRSRSLGRDERTRKDKLTDAMNSLFAKKEILVEETGPPSKRRQRIRRAR